MKVNTGKNIKTGRA